MHALKLSLNDLRKADNKWRCQSFFADLLHHLRKGDADVLFTSWVGNDVPLVINAEISSTPAINAVKFTSFLNLANVHLFVVPRMPESGAADKML